LQSTHHVNNFGLADFFVMKTLQMIFFWIWKKFLHGQISITGCVEDHAQDKMYAALNTIILFHDAVMLPSLARVVSSAQ
jgi:hypothetical protein